MPLSKNWSLKNIFNILFKDVLLFLWFSLKYAFHLQNLKLVEALCEEREFVYQFKMYNLRNSSNIQFYVTNIMKTFLVLSFKLHHTHLRVNWCI